LVSAPRSRGRDRFPRGWMRMDLAWCTRSGATRVAFGSQTSGTRQQFLSLNRKPD